MEVRDHLIGRERAESPRRFGPLVVALTAYTATFALGALWTLKAYAKHEWLPAWAILRTLLLGPFFIFPFVPLICASAMTASLVLRRNALGVLLGCGAVAVWVLAGFLLCSLHIT